ncbi:hypothetical protein BDU57DRAFT_95919 [Ampelomyces quisqualis]|uniref:Uncharacterized protein n=1 Tax=Ampelomyces quisqualis TaxID=50730 RepID=A0A6A5Q898_AMPQU|nr:hypothetical protein BDU57DRAFT_95919 [Ampelomyces quisqualis]
MKTLKNLLYYVAAVHEIPTEDTTHIFMQYCYEYNVWTASKRVWTSHLEHAHLKHLNNYCGRIARCGVVVVAAYCLFCLGDGTATLHIQFAQYRCPDTHELHKHMKTHRAQIDALPAECPHPLCHDHLESEAHFWEHANTVHSIAAFGPRRINRKRETPEGGHEDSQDALDWVADANARSLQERDAGN